MYYSLCYGKSLPICGALLYYTPRKVHVTVTTHFYTLQYSKQCSLLHLSMTCRVAVFSTHHNLRNRPLCVLVLWEEIHPSSSRQHASSPSGAWVPAVWCMAHVCNLLYNKVCKIKTCQSCKGQQLTLQQKSLFKLPTDVLISKRNSPQSFNNSHFNLSPGPPATSPAYRTFQPH